MIHKKIISAAIIFYLVSSGNDLFASDIKWKEHTHLAYTKKPIKVATIFKERYHQMDPNSKIRRRISMGYGNISL